MSPYSIRQATESDAEGIAFVHVKSWQTSYVGIVDQAFLNNISYDKRLASWKEILKSKKGLRLVALFDGQVVGFVGAGLLRSDPHLNLKEENIGEVYAIYLLEEHKGKGLGKALFQECRLWFAQQDIISFVTWVLTENLRAKQFYECEGGTIIAERIQKIGEKDYNESCYVFA